MSDAILTTQDLSMHFGGVVANSQVNFALKLGELRCLIGPNGAGKSTFFKCLTGQLTPTHGKVIVKDRDMTGRESHAFARMGLGIKTQVPNVFDGISVEENIWLACRRHHGNAVSKRMTADTIERVRLGDIRRADVGTLAHGQRQWVEIAMVTVFHRGEILMEGTMDEVTSDETVRDVYLGHGT